MSFGFSGASIVSQSASLYKTEEKWILQPVSGSCLAMEPASLISSSSFSSSENQLAEEESTRNWEELPRDIMLAIEKKLTPREILESMQLVCKSWYEVCKDPAGWTEIQIIRQPGTVTIKDRIPVVAVNRSRGGLLKVSLEEVCDDSLLLLIAERSSCLRSLCIQCCEDLSDDAIVEAFKQLPLLEEVEFTLCGLKSAMVRSIGQSCPNLVSFKLNGRECIRPAQAEIEECNRSALAIAETMPRLQHLQLIGSTMTNEGLLPILDSCSCLESLDLRVCSQVDLSGSIGKRCAEQVKNVKWPQDSTSDYPFDFATWDIMRKFQLSLLTEMPPITINHSLIDCLNDIPYDPSCFLDEIPYDASNFLDDDNNFSD